MKEEDQLREQKRWCRRHPTGKWGINPDTGRFYLRCSIGNQLLARGFKPEPCVAGEE